MVLDGNIEGAQYILGFKVLRDNKNRKIMLCQAYTLVSFEDEGLCAFASNCWDSLEGDNGWQDTLCGEPSRSLHQDTDRKSLCCW